MNITQILEQLNIPLAPERHHHVSRGWVGIDCPHCTPNSHRFRCGINTISLACHCWSCGKLSLTVTLQLSSKANHKNITQLLSHVIRYTQTTREQSKTTLKIPYGIGPLLEPHKNYLQGRGFNPKELQRLWGVQGIGPISHKGLAWRLYIPVKSEGIVVNWTARSITDTTIRYRNAPHEWEQVPRNHLLYGEGYCSHTVIVCEGPTDVWRIGPGAVCTFGLAYSTAQVEKISRYGVRVICFDNEPDAQTIARKLCRKLKAFPGETWNVILDSKDPGSATQEEIQQLRERFLT